MIAACALSLALPAAALPPRAQWRASSSAQEMPSQPSSFAIDGDVTTAWTGPFAENHWLQIDTGRVSSIAGATVQWGTVSTTRYRIQASTDGKRWQTVHAAEDGRGGTEYVFFAPVQARYLRLASAVRTSDWGVWVSEFAPVAAADAPKITGVSAADAAALWAGVPTSPRKLVARELRIKLPREWAIAGLQLYWAAPRRSVRLEAREGSEEWRVVDADLQAEGDNSFLAARQPMHVDELRVVIDAEDAPLLKQLRLLGQSEVSTPWRRYAVAASRRFGDAFPPTIHSKQVYWTLVGTPAGLQKSLFDEFGNLEPTRRAPLVQPVWRDRSGKLATAASGDRGQTLRQGWMPMPTLQWSPRPGLLLRTEAFAATTDNVPYTLVRYRLSNVGSATVDGRLGLLVRPMQVNPPWQHGGLAPIRAIVLDGITVRVNDRPLLHTLTPPDARTALGFGKFGETEITRLFAEERLPTSNRAEDADGLAAAALAYDVQLAPGDKRDVVLAFPLGDAALRPAWRDSDFDRLADETQHQWHERFGRIGLRLPDAAVADAVRAQMAYMLLNQTGHALQPGPRNYDRSFVRDGAATASLMLRMGQPKVARDYLRWYAAHAVHPNGLVSPILNADGTVAQGWGSDIEYDSQGQFINLVADIARLDGGPQTVREYLPQVKLAMQFLVTLRERTMVAGYMSDHPAPERFRGILAPSISHEGFATPQHSYWDDYWALKGWHDGAWLAQSLGDHETAQWALEQRKLLRDATEASIRSTMTWARSGLIPAAAERADSDATGLSIALDPCDALDALPIEALQRTFDAYHAAVIARGAGGSNYAYTPYEFRNVLSFVRLGQPDRAHDLMSRLWRDRRPWYVFPEVVHSDPRRAIYIGDMPHTWIGGELVRAVLGSLFHEDAERIELLPGVPMDWLVGDGSKIERMPTAFGPLTLEARLQGKALILKTAGLRDGTAVQVWWPNRRRPSAVRVDGTTVESFNDRYIKLDRPFEVLEATW